MALATALIRSRLPPHFADLRLSDLAESLGSKSESSFNHLGLGLQLGAVVRLIPPVSPAARNAADWTHERQAVRGRGLGTRPP